jgi:hypothetical protein
MPMYTTFGLLGGKCNLMFLLTNNYAKSQYGVLHPWCSWMPMPSSHNFHLKVTSRFHPSIWSPLPIITFNYP